MTRMALWQKWLYHGGEVVMVLGILWAIYRVLILHVCPLHWFNDITVIAFGLLISVLPLHPFGNPAYLTAPLRRIPVLALAWWLFAVGGVGYALYAAILVQLGWHLAVALLPAIAFLWFGLASKLSDSPLPGGGAGKGKEGRDA